MDWLYTQFGVQFGSENFWDHHGIFFLLFITIFPRLTLLFSSVPFGGVLWWLGFIFAPRVLVAFLATVAYWDQNPVLVVISWIVALSGESGEKYYAKRRVRTYRVYRGQSAPAAAPANNDAIDVDYKRMD